MTHGVGWPLNYSIAIISLRFYSCYVMYYSAFEPLTNGKSMLGSNEW